MRLWPHSCFLSMHLQMSTHLSMWATAVGAYLCTRPSTFLQISIPISMRMAIGVELWLPQGGEGVHLQNVLEPLRGVTADIYQSTCLYTCLHICLWHMPKRVSMQIHVYACVSANIWVYVHLCSYGLCSYSLCNYGLCSCGLHGLFSYGLCSLWPV